MRHKARLLVAISELDIYRSARLLIKQCGDSATSYAAERADALARAGDDEGHLVWLRIGAAVEELERTEPRIGELTN